MVRLLTIPSITTTSISFSTYEIQQDQSIAYVVYDTSTGIMGMNDYYVWRTITATSTGNAGPYPALFQIDNTTLYPAYSTPITDYTTLNPRLLYVVTLQEAQLIENLLTRLDLVRRRLPNPGRTVTADSSVGEGGVVSQAGGFEKKFTVKELISFIEGAVVEINIHPPAVQFYWWWTTVASEKTPNPYRTIASGGVPQSWMDLIVQGAMIRALISWGIFEVDTYFNASDNGLSIVYDRVNYVSSWFDKLLAEFKSQKDLIKWDCVNSAGVGVGTVAFSATGIVGQAANMLSSGGIMAMNSLMGFNLRGFTPL